MPFQANPNAGQPDPTLLNLLFQQKARREELAYQRQQDAMAAQRQAQLDAAEEARKDREHRTKVAGLLLDAQLKVRKEMSDLGESQETARQQVGAVERAAPVTPQAEPIVRGEELPAGIFPLMPQDEQNAALQLQAQERFYVPVAAQQAALANSISEVPELAPLREMIPDLAAQRFATKTRHGQEEEQKAIRTENRAEERAIDADVRQARIAEERAQKDYQRAISKTGNEVIALEDQIEEQRAIQKTAPIGSPAFLRAKTLEAKLNAAMSRKLTEGVDPGHFANVQKWMDDNVSLVQESEAAIQDAKAFLQMAESNPNFLGTTRGGLTQYISNMFEGAADIAGLTGADSLGTMNQLSQSALRLFMSDSTLLPAQRDKLGRELGIGSDGTLQARADAKVLSARIAYMVTRLQNPGRFSNEQYSDNHARMRFDKGTAAQSLRNLKSAIAELEGMSARTKQRISVYEGLQPGVMGGLVGAAGQQVLPAAEPTPFASIVTQPASAGNATMPPVKFGKSGLPLMQSAPPAGPSGISTEQYMNLSPEEKTAVLEKLLREGK